LKDFVGDELGFKENNVISVGHG